MVKYMKKNASDTKTLFGQTPKSNCKAFMTNSTVVLGTQI